MTRLHVAGVALRGSGYPNAAQTIRALEQSPDWQVEDGADWLPDDVHLWRIARGPMLQRVVLMIRLLGGNAVALLRLVHSLRRRPGIAYVPYPAAFLLWWASWLPPRWRPCIIADAYISLWDSAFQDRSRAPEKRRGLAEKLAKSFEGRALRAASVVLVDTLANRDFMIAEFGLNADRVRAVPLAIDIAHFHNRGRGPASHAASPMRVLFVGTLIPLHGIGVLADTVRLAGPDAGMVFHFVGDGQEHAVLEALQADALRAPMEWERGWLTLPDIASRMEQADVCLGVFGGDGKAARVLPFKLYMALAAGKAIVTQESYSLPAGLPALPVATVAPDAAALLQVLLRLQRNQAERSDLESSAIAFHTRWLSADALRQAWQAIATEIIGCRR